MALSISQSHNLPFSYSQGQIQEAIALVNDFHPEQLDNDRYLYFHLQQQQLIELIRGKQVEEALEFAQIHLAERGEGWLKLSS